MLGLNRTHETRFEGQLKSSGPPSVVETGNDPSQPPGIIDSQPGNYDPGITLIDNKETRE